MRIHSLVFVLLFGLAVSPVQALKADDPPTEQIDYLVLGPVAASQDEGEPDPDQVRSSVFRSDRLFKGDDLKTLAPAVGDKVKVDGKELVWKQVSSTDGPGLDLDKAIGRHIWSIAYVYREIESQRAENALLGIGSDDAVRVWLNGERVHSKWQGRGLQVDEDLITVKLRAGKNRLLIKVVNFTQGWGVSARIVSPSMLAENLGRAVYRSDRDAVKQLLTSGVDPNSNIKLGLKPIQIAKIRGDVKTAEMLLAAGAEDLSPPDESIVADAIWKTLPNSDLPGLSVLVARDGKVLFERAIGYANLSDKVPATTETKFRIGSVSKQFTSAAILTLVEDGKLGLTDTLDSFLPDFPRGDEVTVHQLLTHTSGIPSYTDAADFMKDVTDPISEDDMVAKITCLAKEYSFDPGSDFHYNNSGYFLLGHLVRKVSGQSLGDYLQAKFFGPLDMSDTGVHSTDIDLKNEALGYSMSEGNAEDAINWSMSRAGGAGALYSTVNDLMKWNEAVFDGKVLKKETLEKAFTPVEPSGMGMKYGYGWMIGEQRGLQTINHSGGLQGFLSYLTRFPDQNLTVVAFHNCAPPVVDLEPGRVAGTLAEVFLWKEMDPRPTFEVDPSVDSALFDRYVGRYDYGSAVMSVTKEDDKLFAQLSGQPKLQVFPASETVFFWKVVDASVQFNLDEQGNCVSVQHRQGLNQFEAKRLPDLEEVELTTEQLDDFVGVYDYVQAKMTISRKDKQLVAQMQGQPAFPIFPQGEDVFAWKVITAEIQFQRDEDGKVIGATHTQGGAKIPVKKIE